VAPADSEDRRATLVDAYAGVRSLTDSLTAVLTPEDQTVQSMPDVSPTKWHRAHTSWFFETFLLEPALDGYERFDPAYGYLFNSYYEAVGDRYPRAERGTVSRPGVVEIARYRRHVDAAMDALLAAQRPDDVLDLTELGVHHEQQHQELVLMDIKHVLSKSPLWPAYASGGDEPGPALPHPPGAADAPKLGWVEHQGGIAEIGHRGPGFAYDNESPRHRTLLAPFALADRLVTCGEWVEFIEDDGYHRPDLWLSEGWATRGQLGWEAPLYWQREQPGWAVFTLAGRRALDPAEPVCHVSYFEADAYARWAGARLPVESEWESVAVCSDEDPALARYALHPDAAGGAGLRLYGDVWQWTQSAYSPYPGFRPAAGAVGEYNGKFMVNQQVLRGSCCLTPPGHARATYRNFYPAGARWACAGLRLARDL
jgi:ergothioneine biosynthesis protein EgtB